MEKEYSTVKILGYGFALSIGYWLVLIFWASTSDIFKAFRYMGF